MSITTLFLWSCTETTTGGGEEELQPLDFTTTPSDELSNIVENSPSDFTWPFYNDNLTVGLDPEPESFEGEIVLSVFQVRNGEVTSRLTTDPVGTNLEELSSGLSTEEMYADELWYPGSLSVPTTKWIPSTKWYPGSMWAPSEIESIAMSENELSANQTMVVVYPKVEGDLPNRDQVTQPYGLIFEEKEPTTGTLQVITETNANGDGNEYPLAVDGNSTDTLAANDTMHVSGLQEGSHQVDLKGLAANCTISGQNPRSVNVTAADTTSTTFEVQCDPPKSMIERFAGESGSVRVVNAEAFGVRPGGLPFLLNPPFLTMSPDNLMLIIPESASADGILELNEMMGIIYADGEKQPFDFSEAYRGSQWYRFSGEEFYPGSQWISDQASYLGSQWTPETLADMEIAFVNGDQSMTELFGGVDFSGNSESTDSPIQSDKKLGIAARADLLFGMDVSINKDLDEVLNQSSDNLDIISGKVNTGGMLVGIVGDPTKDIGSSAIWSVSGDQFYPGSMWTPENVSVFSAFMTDIFETGNNPFLADTQMLLVGGDVFNSAPERFSLIEPGQTVDGLSNYQMFVASSVLDVDLDLYPTVGSNLDFQELSPVSSGDASYFPESFYHPTDFTFPEQLQSSDARFVYLPFEPSYNYSAITEFGITVNIEQ